jgi:hypothetical protein
MGEHVVPYNCQFREDETIADNAGRVRRGIFPSDDSVRCGNSVAGESNSDFAGEGRQESNRVNM